MKKQHRHIGCALFLTGILCACGAGSPVNESNANTTATATVTLFVLPPEDTPALTASPTLAPNAPSGSTPTLTPTISVTGKAPRPFVTVGPLCDDAIYNGDVTIPDGTAINPGVAFRKIWRIHNMGTCNWTTAYTLAYAAGDSMSGVTTHIPEAVNSGDFTEVFLDLVAPTIAGTYAGNWQLKNAAGFFFGGALSVKIVVPTISVSNTPIPTATTLCDDAIYVSDVTIPDGTKIESGTAFRKTWSVRNRGTCNWTTEYTLVFASGNEMSGVTTRIPNAVGAGDTTEIWLDLVAPTIPGSYIGHWQLRNADGFFFGTPLFVQIVVP